ncbi:MAG: hypothetical protein AABZ12_00170 [Planctomycetota bacterium]
MEKRQIQHSAFNIPHSRTRPAFSLVELLTVIFIISLLIAILIPSLGSARNAAKKLTTSKAIDSIKVGLEMFKNEQGSDFAQTNGYPPSFSHPPIPGMNNPHKPHLGQFPFVQGNPVVYGAHWLPAMLIGTDLQGYVSRKNVPEKSNLRKLPEKWYTPDPLADGTRIERAPLYIDPGNMRMLKTASLPGRRPENLSEFFPDWDATKNLPVIVDAFDQPILYYVANTHGKPTNMLEDKRKEAADYSGGSQKDGVPYYFHQDNVGFTGDKVTDTATGATNGWDFGTGAGGHRLAVSGAELTAAKLVDPEAEINNVLVRHTFARYIVDRKLYANYEGASPPENSPLRPVNADSFLLISAGVDGLYGDNDDVSNLPAWENPP